VVLLGALEKAPDVKTLHLHSQGGRLLAAKRMANIVEEFNLDTYVKESCASACTVVFLAGKNKLLATEATLSFHASSFGSLSASDVSELGTDLRETYEQYGLPQWFISKVFETNSDNLWSPSHSDLLRAKVIDKRVSYHDYGFSGVGSGDGISKKDLESGLLTHDYMLAIKDFDNPTFERIKQVSYENMKAGLPLKTTTQSIRSIVHEERLSHYIKQASNQAVIGYYKVLIEQMLSLKEEYPLACVSFVYPEVVAIEFHVGNHGSYPKELEQAELDAIASLVRSKQDNLTYLDEAEQKQLIEKLINNIRAKNPSSIAVIAAPSEHIEKPTELCDASISLMEGFLGFNDETTANLIRSVQ
jgi:hypothetical protein